MKYARLAVNHRTDEKIQQLTNGQRLLFIDLICWSVEHETAGRIPSAALPAITKGHRDSAKALCLMTTLGLLSEYLTSTQGIAYAIVAFDKWQMNSPAKYPKSAGQATTSDSPSHVGAGRRTATRPDKTDRSKDLDLRSSEAHAPAQETSDSDIKWTEIMQDLEGNRPILIDGQLCGRVDGQWVPINGSAR